jgi:hypothetical protein
VGEHRMVSRYGAEHQALRRRLVKYAVGSACVRCGRIIREGDPVDLDHTDDGTGYLGLACASCNRRAGAIKGNTARGRRKHMDLRGIVAGCDIARDRSRTALVVAGWATHPEAGEVVACRLHLFNGPGSLEQVAAALGPDRKPVAVNGLGHMRSLADALKAQFEVVEARAQDVVDANARLLDAVRAGQLKMIEPHPELTAAVQHAKVRPLIEGQALDKRGAERDLAPLAALELAVWLLASRESNDYDVMASAW